LYAPVAVDVVAQFFENKENSRKISIGLVGKGTHYFSREHVLRDAWHRVDDFFALHLRGDLSRGH